MAFRIPSSYYLFCKSPQEPSAQQLEKEKTLPILGSSRRDSISESSGDTTPDQPLFPTASVCCDNLCKKV